MGLRAADAALFTRALDVRILAGSRRRSFARAQLVGTFEVIGGR